MAVINVTSVGYGQPIVSDAVHVMLGCISEINSLQTVLRDR